MTRAGESGPARSLTPDRWHLQDERVFLLRSLEDADRERAAGDLDPDDHRLLRTRDQRRLAEVERELDALDRDRAPATAPTTGDGGAAAGHPTADDGGRAAVTTPDGHAAATTPRPPRHRRPWLAVVGTAAVVLGLVLLVVHLSAPRLLGENASGSIELDRSQLISRQLAQAAAEVDTGSVQSIEQGLGLYRQVLAEDPRQPQALAETGYLEWETGFESGRAALAARGRQLIERSVAVQGDDYAAHLFLGTIELEQDHRAAAAVTQFGQFLAERPPATLVATAAPVVRRAFAEAGRPVPAGLPR